MKFNELVNSLATPAQRALSDANISSYQALSNLKYHQLKALHGIGPKALKAIEKAMLDHGYQFKPLELFFEFEAIIEKVEGIDGAYVTIPLDIKEEFGVGRLKVKADFEGISYSGSIVNMGTGNYILGLLQSIRKALNKQPGDTIHVKIEAIL